MSPEYFDTMYKETSDDAHGFLHIDVILQLLMQFHKEFTNLLVVHVQGNEMRNMNMKWLI